MTPGERRKFTFASGNPKPGEHEAFAAGWEGSSEDRQGRDPRTMTIAELHGLGHEGVMLKAIRQNCVECQSGYEAEVRRCRLVWCPMWPYRMNANPFRRIELSDEERAIRGARLRALREASAD